MSAEREARFLSGTDIGRVVGPFVGTKDGGLAYKRTGKLIGVLQTKGSVEIYTEFYEDDPLIVDSDHLIPVTGEPSERELEL